MLDDRVPHTYLGAGYPRAHDVLDSLCALGHKVSFLPCMHTETNNEARRGLPRRCVYLPQKNQVDVVRYVEQQSHRYDVLWVSRPHNMALLQRYLPCEHPVWQAYSLVVYDAEAIFALRAALMETFYPAMPTGKSLASELALAEVADVVAVVNQAEGRYFARHSVKTVVLSAPCDPKASNADFSQRRGFLFVGSLRDHPSPNSDAIIWYCREVVPLLREALAGDFNLEVAGIVQAQAVSGLAAPDIHMLGLVPDLSECYQANRVFIAPHRFAAGIPSKVLEAAANGLPVVASQLLAQQLEWNDMNELVTANTESPVEFADACLKLYRQESLWQTLRQTALARLVSDFSQTAFEGALTDILDSGRAG